MCLEKKNKLIHYYYYYYFIVILIIVFTCNDITLINCLENVNKKTFYYDVDKLLINNNNDTVNNNNSSGKIEGDDDDDYVEINENFTWPIVAKCCQLGFGYSFDTKSTCIETDDEFIPDFDDRPDYLETAKELPIESRYEYYIGDPCYDGKYILDGSTYSYDDYKIYSNGSLLYLDDVYDKEEFCMETVNSTLRVFICFGIINQKTEFKKDFKFILYATGLLISVPFLLTTAFIYLSIDLLRDLRGKSLSCHVICLAIGYLFLALVQLFSDQLNEEICIASGFLIQYFFVSAFFWLNAICYDTWRCIKNDFCCIYKPINVKSEKIMFCYYVIYAFYGPLVLSIVSLIMDLEPTIPESYLKPHFGFHSCWFYSDAAALPYFYGPIGVSGITIFYLFVLRPQCVRKEVNRKIRKLWIKIKTCDLNKEESKRVSQQHWHSQNNEMLDTCSNHENNKFINVSLELH
ncbi:class B secretin-like G-protein coupled receptor GPRmth7, putative [Pediculus humanus corporis]|uniref:Class B secretin-like G-protein coupled receptor GPRmth7, putative n=1 Tax=Pediculus humanus subsp. corporis TaxID=121224 RepID=E0VKX0_PEDHC|nr:class B secretin-like G-protein coupled receptor GPRmth7, putative [Pediculus humanus corporis]EEB14026.1 class B secretin-like G-protein coupled receptor GPRmth7, putative [Pediculus humanus corporis]